MPIYVVRWPDLSAALVRADSAEELEHVLDEVSNPEGCTWSVYRGPLFIEFSLPVDLDVKQRRRGKGPIEPDDLVVGDVSRLGENALLNVSIPIGDTSHAMIEAVAERAFPHVFKALRGVDTVPSEPELREAIRAELHALVRASWRHEHLRRRNDLASRLAVDMGTTTRVVLRSMEAAPLDATTPLTDSDDPATPEPLP